MLNFLIALCIALTIVFASLLVGLLVKIIYDEWENAPEWMEGLACALISPRLFNEWKKAEESEKE